MEDMIHIIDDDKNVRDGFTLLLNSAGYECDSFEGAEEFLDCCKPGENDLLILDVQLTGMSGCALLENLAKRGMQLPVIMVTAFDERISRNCAKDYGAIAYLRKPVDCEALIDLIRFNVVTKNS
jgi:FixJ family two-component response regulator